jgi:hypothetical protein
MRHASCLFAITLIVVALVLPDKGGRRPSRRSASEKQSLLGVLIALSMAVVALGPLTAHTALAQSENEVSICHRTGSASNSWKAIEVSPADISAHLAHGDFRITSSRQCPPPGFTYVIDDSVSPIAPTLPGLDGGPPRLVDVVVNPDGRRDLFVVNEVVFSPTSQAELDAFVKRYNGRVLRDGRPLLISEAGVSLAPPSQSSGRYLVQVDLRRSSLANIADYMAAAGRRTVHVFVRRWRSAGRAACARETAQRPSQHRP